MYPAVSEVDEQCCLQIREQLAAGPVVHDLLGVTVEVSQDLAPYVVYLLLNNAYEHGDLALIRKYVTAADKALVLGAGIGVIGTALAQQTVKAVHLVDANPELQVAVARTAELNNSVLSFQHGAIVPGESDGSIEFTLSDEFWASSLRADTYRAVARVSAPILSLSTLLLAHRPSTLFVDIEGAEVGLFSQEELTDVSKLFVEIHRPNIGTRAWAEVIADIHAQGFQMRDAAGLTCYFERT